MLGFNAPKFTVPSLNEASIDAYDIILICNYLYQTGNKESSLLMAGV